MSIYPGLGFGPGYLLCAPVAGNLAPNPTPQMIAVLQNMNFDIAGDIKELKGQQQYPVDTAVADRTIKGKFEFASISNLMLAQLCLGDAVTTGCVETALDEAHSVPATPFTVTVTNATGFHADWGVKYANGNGLMQVPSSPAVGQYSVNLTTGVYTFAAADTGAAILISYAYTSATLNTTLQALNHPKGWGPVIAVNAVLPYEGNGIGYYFPYVRFGKVSIATKISDYTMCTVDFAAFTGGGTSPFTSYQLF